MSLLDTAIASKIKKSQDSQEKAEKQLEATRINNAALKLAGQSGDPRDLEMATSVIEAIGNSNPEVSRIILGNIEGRIKSYVKDDKASEVIATAQQPGGLEKLQEQYPMGAKASQGGVSIEVPSLIKSQSKISEEKEKKSAKSEEISKGTYRFLQQFQRSNDELMAYDPKIGEIGFGGWLSRNAAKLGEKMDAFPETTSLLVDIDTKAQEIASELEGGRVTDQDRAIQAKRFANAVKFPTKTNIRLMANAYIDLFDKGGDSNGAISSQLKKLVSTKSDIFNAVAEQVLAEYPEKAKEIFGEEYEVVP